MLVLENILIFNLLRNLLWFAVNHWNAILLIFVLYVGFIYGHHDQFIEAWNLKHWFLLLSDATALWSLRAKMEGLQMWVWLSTFWIASHYFSYLSDNCDLLRLDLNLFNGSSSSSSSNIYYEMLRKWISQVIKTI